MLNIHTALNIEHYTSVKDAFLLKINFMEKHVTLNLELRGVSIGY